MEKEALLDDLIRRYPVLAPCRASIRAAYGLLLACYQQGGKLLICGNGGSAADAEHMVGELVKGFHSKRPLPEAERAALSAIDPALGAYVGQRLQGGLPALALSGGASLATAVLNDVAGDMIYAQQAYALCKPGDVLLGLSTSGNAKNVLLAALCAKARGCRVIALTGRDGGALGGFADVAIRAPETQTYLIQELHLPVYHCLCAWLEAALFSA